MVVMWVVAALSGEDRPGCFPYPFLGGWCARAWYTDTYTRSDSSVMEPLTVKIVCKNTAPVRILVVVVVCAR